VFEDSLPVHLVKTKDMFVFGCTVALRVSDILNLTWNNIEKINGESYLKIISQKTQTFTKIILPDYAVIILKKYTDNQERIFPKITNSRLNKNIKSLIELTNWTETRIKTRQKRGMPIHVLKNNEKYRFCDHITSHTMRRTAITNLLCLGVPENVVRKISGHTANSKEFFKYVELSQKFIDTESEKAWDHLK
jgi:integrase